MSNKAGQKSDGADLKKCLALIEKITLRVQGGDGDTIEELLRIAEVSVRELDSLTHCHWEHATGLAKKRTSWPVLLDLHPDYLTGRLTLINELFTGERVKIGHPPGLPDARYQRGTPVNFIVESRLKYIAMSRSWNAAGSRKPDTSLGKLIAELPDLDYKSVPLWAEAIIASLKFHKGTSGDILDDEALFNLGKNKLVGRKISLFENRKTLTNKQRSDVERGIKDRFCTAIRVICGLKAGA